MPSESRLSPGKAESPRTVFVEIGPGEYPVFEYGSVGFYPDHVYVGFDTSKETIRKLREKAGNLPFMRLESVEEDSTYPFPDNSADTVYIGNVFGIPGAVDDIDLHLIYSEGVRMAKPNGRLVILEHLTPPWSKEYFERIIERTRRLRLERSISPLDPDWPRIAGQYNTRALDPFHEDGYILVATKVPAEQD